MAEPVIMPKAGMAMEEGVIGKWYKQEGDPVEKGELLLEIETDKVAMDLESEVSGTLLKILCREGETVPVITTIAWIGQPGEEIPEEETGPAAVTVTAPASAGREDVSAVKKISQGDGRIAATPAAKRIAMEKGISLSGITPTGRYGEVRLRDVESLQAIKATPLARKIASDSGIDLATIQGSGFAGKVRRADLKQRVTPASRRVPIRGIRKMIAERMLQTHTQVPSATLVAKADMTAIAELRATGKANGAKPLSFNDYVMKAVSIALAKHPIFNASIEGDEIVYWDEIHIGVAVALDNGLIVPVVKNADRLTIEEISAQTKTLATKAREGGLTPDEITGGTFTVTNLGMYGIGTFTPIINLPEVAILGVGAIEDIPALHEGQLVTKKIMPLSLTHDHRVIDGAQGALFLQCIANSLENPNTLNSPG